MLSEKQKQALRLLEYDPVVTDVLFGGGAGCFKAGTLVLTKRGHIPIESINKGDLIGTIDRGRLSFNKCVKLFSYGGGDVGHKLIKFTLSNNEIIECTYDHRFYFEGNWQPASGIARRIMASDPKHIKQVLHFDNGPIDDYRTLWRKEACDNEASEGCTWVFKDDVKNGFWKLYRENAPLGLFCLYFKSRKQETGKSQKRSKDGQSSGQSRMVNSAGKYKTRLRKWLDKKTNLHKVFKRIRKAGSYFNRTGSKRDQVEIQEKSLHTANAWGGIWRKSCYDKGCNSEKKLEARSIRRCDILKIDVCEYSVVVYDIHVNKSHNYCITTNNFVVHNSGKSFLGCFWQISRRLFNPGTAGLIGRDSLVNIKNTTLVTFFRVWSTYFASNPMGVTIKPDGQRNVLNFSNGSYTYLKGLAYNSSDPEFTDLGSLELTDAFIDEVNGCAKKGVDIVASRIRYNLINNKSPILMTANPGYDWVRDRFFREKDGSEKKLQPHEARVVALLSDNPDPVFREQYKRQLEKLPLYDRLRLLDGDWDAVNKPENPFLYDWEEYRHVQPCSCNPNLPLIISLDFNVNPLCGLFAQVYRDNLNIIGEITIDSGSIAKLTTTIENYLKDHSISKSRVLITGDKNGGARKIGEFDNKSSYVQIKEALRLSDHQFMLPGNPMHSNSRSDCNEVLRTWNVSVNPTCRGLIGDAGSVSCNEHGEIIKRNRALQEQRADHLDAFRYLVNTFCKSKK